MRCKRCGKRLNEKNRAYSCGFAGYCRDCELDMCHKEGFSESIVPVFWDKESNTLVEI